MTESTPTSEDAVLETAGSLRAATDKLERLATGLSGQTHGCPHRQRRLDINSVLVTEFRGLADRLEQQPEQWRAHQSPVSRTGGRGHSPAIRHWQYMAALAVDFIDSGERAFALDLDGTAFDLFSLTQEALDWVSDDAFPEQEKPWWPSAREAPGAIH